MQVRIVTVASDNGDGSASCLFFNTEDEAAEYIQAYEESMGECINPENITSHTLVFEDGVLMNPDKWED